MRLCCHRRGAAPDRHSGSRRRATAPRRRPRPPRRRYVHSHLMVVRPIGRFGDALERDPQRRGTGTRRSRWARVSGTKASVHSRSIRTSSAPHHSEATPIDRRFFRSTVSPNSRRPAAPAMVRRRSPDAGLAVGPRRAITCVSVAAHRRRCRRTRSPRTPIESPVGARDDAQRLFLAAEEQLQPGRIHRSGRPAATRSG